MSLRSFSILLVGLGIGTAGGGYLGSVAIWPGVVITLVGMALSFVGPGRDLSAPETTGRSETERPTMANLGTRVEQILSLAERQADDVTDAARVEAERILADARSTARALLDEAAGRTTASPSSESWRTGPGSAPTKSDNPLAGGDPDRPA
ncbi:hypothetical protein GCM10027290_51040 [Micromonospora sonneratiae]|uniref:Uncharacterized protein n=1 Tax=Micromonospora sonneratiae TaxID=1184706 RepID=A0ABW3Y7U6_9ACTN